MQRNKRILIFLLVATMLLSVGCGDAEEERDEHTLDFSSAQTAPPASGADNAQPQKPAGTQTANASQGDLQVVSAVAYALPGTLYGGVEFQNAGNAHMVLKEASFTFAFTGGSEENTFEPVAWDRDVIAPGETGYCTLWLPYEDEVDSASVSLTCSLLGEAANPAENTLRVESARLIQNYPSFATLSGRLVNPEQESRELNLVYAGFYGQKGELLGVFHFTRNAILRPGDGIPFVVHLRLLPIPGLAEHTADIRFHAFSM